jgi:hypothetical protein
MRIGKSKQHMQATATEETEQVQSSRTVNRWGQTRPNCPAKSNHQTLQQHACTQQQLTTTPLQLVQCCSNCTSYHDTPLTSRISFVISSSDIRSTGTPLHAATTASISHERTTGKLLPSVGTTCISAGTSAADNHQSDATAAVPFTLHAQA